jgi:acetoacetyl-CoA synthetase
VTEPRRLWTPPDDVLETTQIGRYLRRLDRGITTYDELWRWSVEDLEGFWGSIWDFFGLGERRGPVLAGDSMPGARWFPEARLNFAEHLLAGPGDANAVVAYSQARERRELTFGELRAQVGRARAGLQRLGVGPGDRVAGYLPNIPETLVAFAAAASLGAVWASCAPELGPRSVIDRLAQLEPDVLLAVDGYGFRDRTIDRRDAVAAVRAALPSLRHVIHVPLAGEELPDATPWDELVAEPAPLAFAPVPFDHPLYVLFSSGTTGLPKAIVHGHGGILVEHLKAHGLSWDLNPGDRILWFSTTSWMMWNALVSALLLETSIVMIDGDPAWPDLGWQWRLAAETGATFMGASPAYVMACRKAGLAPGRDPGLPALRTFCTAGSPLPPEGYRWVHEDIGPDVLLINGSGGTDVCSAIVTGSPLQPVWEGEISGAALAVAARTFDQDGREVVGELGELVITRPMPSMPVAFWNDPEGRRYRDSYFEHFEGVWRQGDWARVSPEGTWVITGRSDATLNRGGVRLGTGEFYAVVEELPEVVDSLVVHLEDAEGGAGELLLFVVLADGAELGDDLRARIAGALRGELSPRHVPDRILAIPGIPRTLTGKKLEAPAKRILRGARPEEVANRDALLDPAALDAFVALARGG